MTELLAIALDALRLAVAGENPSASLVVQRAQRRLGDAAALAVAVHVIDVALDVRSRVRAHIRIDDFDQGMLWAASLAGARARGDAAAFRRLWPKGSIGDVLSWASLVIREVKWTERVDPRAVIPRGEILTAAPIEVEVEVEQQVVRERPAGGWIRRYDPDVDWAEATR